MKKIVLIIFFFCMSIQSYSQFFLKDTTKLIYLHHTLHEGPDWHPLEIEQLKIANIDISEDTFFYSSQGSLDRQDRRILVSISSLYSIGQKLFSDFKIIFNRGYNKEDSAITIKKYLLCDLDLEKGDTFWTPSFLGKIQGKSPFSSYSPYYIVDSIHLRQVNDSTSVKEQYLSDKYWRHIKNIENIGNTSGLFQPIYSVVSQEARISRFGSLIAACNQENVLFQTPKSTSWPNKHFAGEVCNQDSLNLFMKKLLGTSVLKATPSVFIVYPNPSRGIIEVRGKGAGVRLPKIEIYDMHGRVVWSSQALTPSQSLTEQQLNISHLKPSIYYIKIYRDDGFFEVHKIVLR